MKSAAATLGLSILCILQWSTVSGCSQRDRLFRDITQGYLKSVEPDDIVLKVSLSIICARLDKTNGGLTTNVWEQLSWADKRLAWDPKDYGNIEVIRLPSHHLWVPDLKLYNSLAPVDIRDQTNVVVSSDGTVIWVPSVIYRTLCSRASTDNELDCQIKVGSWTYDSDTVKLELTGAGVNLEFYQNSTCPLAVESATAAVHTKHYPCCKEPYSHVEVNLQLKPHEV